MFNAQIGAEQLKYLKTIVDVATDIVSGPRTFKFTPEGITFETMEQGSVFVCFIVKKEFFSKYNLQNDLLELRLNIDDLKKVLSRTMEPTEQLEFAFSNSNTFLLTFSKEGSRKRKYELALHNPDEDQEKRNILETIKSIPLDSHLKLEPGLLKQLLGDVGIATEKDSKHLNIKISNILAIFEVNKGSEGMNAVIELPKDNKTIFIDSVNESNSSYDMDYLEKLVKLDTKTGAKQKEVDVELGTDKPLRITFTLTEQLEFLFVMAPLVESDEETEDDVEEE